MSPGRAGEMGESALKSSIIAGIFIPAIQVFLLSFLISIPDQFVVAESYFIVYGVVLVLGILPGALFVNGALSAKSNFGPVGIVAYVLMSLTAGSLFSSGAVAVVLLVGVVFGFFVYLIIGS